MDALRAVGLASSVEPLGFELETIRFVDGRGRSLGSMPLAATRADGQLSQMMQHDDLCRALADLAAGLAHRVRRDPFAGPHYHRWRCHHAAVRPRAQRRRLHPEKDLTVDVPPCEIRMQFGTRCFFAWMPWPDGGTLWFANPPMPREPEHGVLSGMTDAQWRKWLHEIDGRRRRTRDGHHRCRTGPVFGWATHDMPVVRQWYRVRMLVIGDAAHATAPSAGQGASMALEDAVILAKCLHDAMDVATAFASLEAVRRRRVERVVKHALRARIRRRRARSVGSFETQFSR